MEKDTEVAGGKVGTGSEAFNTKPVSEENALGIISEAGDGISLKDEETPPAEQKPEEGKVKEEEGKPAEEKPKEEEKPKVEDKSEEEKLQAKILEDEAKKGNAPTDEKLEEFKKASPEFAEICDKKGVKTLSQAWKIYIDQEKNYTKTTQVLGNIKKFLEPYIVLDENGKAIGWTEEGRKKFGGSAEGKTEISPDMQKAFEEMTGKFWEQFDKNPVLVLSKIMEAVVADKIKGSVSSADFNKSLEGLKSELKPVFERMERERLFETIDEVANEQIAKGDTQAQAFIDKYSKEIETELKKIDPEIRKVSPKSAILQAYLNVKNIKIEEWKNNLRKKEEEALRSNQANADTGNPSGGGGGGGLEPEVAGILNADKSSPDSPLFGN